MKEELLKEIRGFTDRYGILKQMPVKQRKRVIALKWLAERIPPEGCYSEREFNALLNTMHSFGDPATIRREMYDLYLIERDADGSNYRVAEDGPSIEELLQKLG